MAERVVIDAATLRESAAGLAEVAGRVEQTVRALSAQLRRHAGGPSPWGGDEVGRPYGEAYVELEATAFEALLSYADQLRDAGLDVTRDAEALLRSEESNAATIARVEDADTHRDTRDG